MQVLPQEPDSAPTRRQVASGLILEPGHFSTIDRRFIQNLPISLDFSTRRNHYEEVSATHQKTFQWICGPHASNTPWSSFSEWLAEGVCIYWIQGKATSGKSTLMRYISQRIGTRTLLFEWAGSLPVIMPTYFFWNSGTVEQKPQEDFPRSLPFEMFSQRSDLVPIILPELWARRDQYSQAIDRDRLNVEGFWTLPRLLWTVEYTVKQYISVIKIYFFIDGLDEAHERSEIGLFNPSIALSHRPIRNPWRYTATKESSYLFAI